jgi:hypothetical protein
MLQRNIVRLVLVGLAVAIELQNRGFGTTPIGCCPLGTENVHNFCESPESHQQATNNYLKCLIEHGAKDIINQQAQLYITDCANQG